MVTPRKPSRHPPSWASPPLFRNTLLPVASLEDAEASAEAVLPAIGHAGGVLTAVHIVDIGNGWTRQGPTFYRQDLADDILGLIERHGRSYGMTVRKKVLYEQDIAEAIVRVADQIDASAIVFTPRGSGRWLSFFSRNTALELVKNAPRPVVVFPAGADEPEVHAPD